MPKPATVPDWSTDTNIASGTETGTPTKVDPGAAYRAQGGVPGLRFVAVYWNWVVYWLCQWANYLNGLTGESLTWTVSQTFTPAVNTDAITATATGTGSAIVASAVNDAAIKATATGSGSGGEFSSENIAIAAFATDPGALGVFASAENNNAVSAYTSGSGDAVEGYSTGTGRGGYFFASANYDALAAEATGTGSALVASSVNDACVKATSTGTGAAIYGANTGTGYGGHFTAASGYDAVYAVATGAGSGVVASAVDDHAVKATSTGLGSAVHGTSTSSGPGVKGVGTGTGVGGEFTAAANYDALTATATGTGSAIVATSTNDVAVKATSNGSADAISGSASSTGSGGYFYSGALGNAAAYCVSHNASSPSIWLEKTQSTSTGGHMQMSGSIQMLGTPSDGTIWLDAGRVKLRSGGVTYSFTSTGLTYA